TVRSGFEGPRHWRVHADRVHGPDLDHVVVELHPAPPGQDHVDLLRLVVTVRERLAAVRLDAVEREPDRLGLEVAVGEAGLLDVVEAEPRRHVVYFAQVLRRVAHAGSLPASSVASLSLRARAGVSAPGSIRQRQLPAARAGWFI